MTLAPGDILMIGVGPGPLVRAGQRSAIEIDGLGGSRTASSRRRRRPMKRARVAYAGAVHEATPARRGQVAPCRRPRRRRRAVVWLPPFEVGTVVALGLNYADHAKELRFKAQQEPLVFLKGPGALIGHRGQTRRPAGRDLHALRMRAGGRDRPARPARRRAPTR